MRVFILTLGILASAAATAQGAFDMGMLTNTLSQGSASSGGGRKSHTSHHAKRRPLASPSVLRFTPSQAVRRKTVETVVAQYDGSDPAFAQALRKAFAKSDPIEEMSVEVRKLGLDPRNVADGMAVYLVQAWYGARGKVAKGSAEYRAVGRQFGEAMRAIPAFARLGNAAKQEMAESLMLQAALLETGVKRAQRRTAEMPAVKAASVRNAKALCGIDVTRARLGASGMRIG